jgi:hypothetical protein
MARQFDWVNHAVTPMNKEWALENVEEAHARNPDRFFIPSIEERLALKPGTLVRLHFLVLPDGPNLPRAERMWVEITERSVDGRKYVGLLTNQPRYILSLIPGEPIEFAPEHVAQVLIGRYDPRWSDIYEKKAMVSQAALAKGAVVRWLYRETPDREEDSGWRLFSGDETDEYANNAKNVTICSVGWLVDRDPSLSEIIQADIDSAFERAGPQDAWRKIENFQRPTE